MRGRGISFHGPVNSGEAKGHRSKPEVVLALFAKVFIKESFTLCTDNQNKKLGLSSSLFIGLHVVPTHKNVVILLIDANEDST